MGACGSDKTKRISFFDKKMWNCQSNIISLGIKSAILSKKDLKVDLFTIKISKT